MPSKRRSEPSASPLQTSTGWAERLATLATRWTGTNWAFGLAVLAILIWLVTGPVFDYSDTWQLMINTGTTVVTFLIVFLLQRSQNKESRALQLKLNELVGAVAGASNHLIAAEELSEAELARLAAHYTRLAERAVRGKLEGDS